jgi:hypothetical protein
MTLSKDTLSPQLKALKTTDVTPLIRMAGLMLPRALGGFLASLDSKERRAFDQLMPAGGTKKIYLQLTGTPTPPIVIGLAQPLTMVTMSEGEVKLQQIRGIRLTIDNLQLLAEGQTLGNMLRLAWRLKGQTFTILGMVGLFWPLLRLGPAGLRNVGNKAAARFKPLLDLVPGSKK